MTIVNGYADRPETKDWIGIKVDDFDLKLDNVVTSVSRWIDNHCQRPFWKTAAGVQRVFDTCDPYLLDLGPAGGVLASDLVAVTAVETDEDDDGTYETVWAATDYQPTPANAPNAAEPRPWTKLRAVGSRWFPRRWTPQHREGLIRVTGTWGWAAVPEDVKQACLIQCHRIFNRPNSPTGMIGFADFGVVRLQGRLDPDVADNLGPYRHPAAVALVR